MIFKIEMLLSECMMCSDKSIFFFRDYFPKIDIICKKSAEKGITIQNILTKMHKYCKLIQVAFKTRLRGILYGTDHYGFFSTVYT